MSVVYSMKTNVLRAELLVPECVVLVLIRRFCLGTPLLGLIGYIKIFGFSCSIGYGIIR